MLGLRVVGVLVTRVLLVGVLDSCKLPYGSFQKQGPQKCAPIYQVLIVRAPKKSPPYLQTAIWRSWQRTLRRQALGLIADRRGCSQVGARAMVAFGA